MSDLEPLEEFSSDLLPQQRAYLGAFIETWGNRSRAAKAAGISTSTAYRWEHGYSYRGPDAAFVAAIEVARRIAARKLEDMAIVRATEGMKRYRFSSKGEILRFPDHCECDHARERHAVGENGDRGSCVECSCRAFLGAPYYESEVSDRLLQTLLRAKLPQEYAERVLVEKWIRDIDFDVLEASPGGHVVIGRLAAGEHPLVVFSTLAKESLEAVARALPALSAGVELGGPIPEPRRAEGVSGHDRSAEP